MIKNVNNIITFNKLYLFLAVLFIISIINYHNILDIFYLIFLTFYFIRIKLYRWKKYH